MAVTSEQTYTDDQLRHILIPDEEKGTPTETTQQRVSYFLYDVRFSYVPKTWRFWEIEDRMDAYTNAILHFLHHAKHGVLIKVEDLDKWFNSIFRNKRINIFKHKQTKKYRSLLPVEGSALEIILESYGFSAASKTVLEKLIDKERVDKVVKAIEQLSPKCQKILKSRLDIEPEVYKEYEELAEELNSTSGSIRVQYHNCKKKLLEILENKILEKKQKK